MTSFFNMYSMVASFESGDSAASFFDEIFQKFKPGEIIDGEHARLLHVLANMAEPWEFDGNMFDHFEVRSGGPDAMFIWAVLDPVSTDGGMVFDYSRSILRLLA